MQILSRFGLVQPQFVFGDDQGSAYEPYSGFFFFDKNLPSGEFLAKRNLSIGANDFDAGLGGERVHFYPGLRMNRYGFVDAILVHY